MVSVGCPKNWSPQLHWAVADGTSSASLQLNPKPTMNPNIIHGWLEDQARAANLDANSLKRTRPDSGDTLIEMSSPKRPRMRSPDTTVDIQGPPASSQESGRGSGIARGSFPRLPLRAQRLPFKPQAGRHPQRSRRPLSVSPTSRRPFASSTRTMSSGGFPIRLVKPSGATSRHSAVTKRCSRKPYDKTSRAW